MNKKIPAIALSVLTSTAAYAEEKIDKSLLIGDWCYKSIIAKGSSEPKNINTEWVFFDNGKVEIQSEWMRSKKSTLPYEVEKSRIIIPKMNKKYEVDRLTGSEMLLVNVHGSSKNAFSRGKCD